MKTDEKTLAATALTDSSVIITPTIILEWEEDDDSNSNLHNSCGNQVGQAPVPLSIFSIVTIQHILYTFIRASIYLYHFITLSVREEEKVALFICNITRNNNNKTYVQKEAQ